MTTTLAGQTWNMQVSGTTASLRGVAAVTDSVVWASGTGGTWLLTTDGGSSWHSGAVPGAEKLDFRGVCALDARHAWLMAAGEGEKSRIYQTTDGGEHWTLLFTNPDPKGFFDGLAFRDANRGILLGDAVDGRMTVFTTADGGRNWTRQRTPDAVGEEGAFAASNSSLALGPKGTVWFATGGKGAARVFRSSDEGLSWISVGTPLRRDGPSAGIFSLAFSDSRNGIAVGGDYAKDKEAEGNLALTADGGLSWKVPAGSRPAGFRSAVAYLAERRIWVATGTSGSDLSIDGGKNWKQFDGGSWNALAVAAGKTMWAVGEKGKIAKLSF